MLKAIIDAIEAALSKDLLVRTLEAGGLVVLLALACGIAITLAAGAIATGFAGVLGDRLGAEAVARMRRMIRRGGALVTAFLVLGAAVLVGYAIYFQKDLARAMLACATPELLYEGLKVVGLLAAFGIAAALACTLVTRLVSWLESRLTKSGLGIAPEAVKPVAKSLNSLARTLIAIEALLLSLQTAGVPGEYVDPVKLALKLAALVLGALLLARLAHLLLDAMGALIADAPATGAFRYLLRLRDLIALGKRAAEYVIYAGAAKCVAYFFPSLEAVDTLGSKVISTILYALAARVVVEFVALVIHDVFLGAPAEAGAAVDTQSEARARTFVPILRSLASYFVYFFAGLSILKVWGVDTAPILASAGILGLAVGLGAQKLTGDLVAGFFILFEGTYFVGHYISTGDKEGTVESISIRTTSIRDEKGVLHTIPNGSVNVVSNYSTGFVDAVLDVTVSAKTDLDRSTQVIFALGKKIHEDSKDILAPTQVEGLVDLNASDAVLRTRTRVRPGRHEWAKCELRRRLKDAFEAEKIDIKTLKG